MGTLINFDGFLQKGLKYICQLVISHTVLSLDLYLKTGNAGKTVKSF